MTSYELVPFHDHQLLTISEGGRVYVPLKPLVISMGLGWEAQRQRIERDGVLGKGTCILQVPSAGGLQDMLCMPLERIPAFIATIPLGHIKNEEVKRVVTLFKEEAFDVLFAHFFGGRGAAGKQVTATAAEAIKLIDAIKRATIPAERQYLHAMLAQLSDARGLPLPPLDDLIEPDPFGELALQLFERIEAMIAEGALPEHHRREDRIAFTTRELRSAGLHLTGDQRHALKQHTRFIATCKVNCRDGQSRHCWVFVVPTP